MKHCSKCKKEKLLGEFRNDKYTKTGKTSRCKECLSTFKPVKVKCWQCPNSFTKKQSNYKFCSSKCHRKHWSLISGKSDKYFWYQKEYRKYYSKKDGNKCKDCGKIIDNRATRCLRCHCIIMSKYAKQKLQIKRYKKTRPFAYSLHAR